MDGFHFPASIRQMTGCGTFAMWARPACDSRRWMRSNLSRIMVASMTGARDGPPAKNGTLLLSRVRFWPTPRVSDGLTGAVGLCLMAEAARGPGQDAWSPGTLSTRYGHNASLSSRRERRNRS